MGKLICIFIVLQFYFCQCIFDKEDILKHISKEIGKVFIKLVYKKNNNER